MGAAASRRPTDEVASLTYFRGSRWRASDPDNGAGRGSDEDQYEK